MVATLDRFLQRLGDPGRYQVFALLLLATNVFPAAFNPVLIALFAVIPEHRCKINDSTLSSNGSNPWIPSDSEGEQDGCHLLADPTNPKKGFVGCQDGWRYEDDGREATVVGEFDLVCSYSHLGVLAATMYFFGLAIGGPVSGFVADRFGRKPVMMGALVLQAVFGIGIVFADSYQTYVALRFIQGLVIQALLITSYTVVFETFSQKHRSIVVVVVTSLSSVAIILAALTAYAVRSWRYVQLATTLPSLAGIAYFWLIPESIRWLITHKRLQQAEDVAEFYARYNQVSLPATLPHEIDWISRQLPISTKAERNSDPRQLLKRPKLRKYSVIQFYTWFAMALASHTIIRLIPNLGGSIYFSFMTIGGVALSSRLLLIFILPKFGRRILQCVCCIVSGILCFVASMLSTYANGDFSVKAASVGCALFGVAFVSACLSCMHLYTAELYPTVIRSVGTGSCAFFRGFGDILAPYLLLLSDHLWQPFPSLFIGIVTLVAGILTLLLPETLKIPLPDTIEDSENIETIYSTRSRGRSFRKVISETVT